MANELENFRLVKDPVIRFRTEYIILVPILSFREKTRYIDSVVINSMDLYVYNIWEKYLLHLCKHKYLPYHYFISRVGDDFVTIKGQPDVNKSYWLEDCVSASIIDLQYRNSIIVGIDYNFNIYNTDRRLCEQLSFKILSHLMKLYKLNPDRIKFLDEVLKDNWKENLEDSILEYTIEESKFFDFNILIPYINKYKMKG